MTCSTVFALLIAEVGFRLFTDSEPYHRTSPYRWSSYPTMKKPNFTREEAKYKPDGQPIYEVAYHFDHHGRRRTPVKVNAKEANLIFGCSHTFGEGVHEEESLPWLFSESSGIQTYNYAFSGYGPNNMLAIIHEHDLDKQIPPHLEKVDVSFFSYGFHTERYQGAFRWVGRNRTNEPFFEIIDGELVNRGNFAKNRALTTFIYWALYHSKLARHLLVDWGNHKGEDSQNLFCSIVNSSFEKLKAQFKGRFRNFYLVIAPFQGAEFNFTYYENIKGCLHSDIKVLDILKDSLEYQSKTGEFQLDPIHDFHPNASANKWLNEKLMDFINSD